MKQMSRKDYEDQKFYFTKDNCPFCTKLDISRIVFKTKYWIIVPNLNPYFDDKNHLMAIPKRHIEFTVDLNGEELKDFLNIEKWMQEFYKDKWEYLSFIRQTKSNKSVEHLHYHYIVWIPSPRTIKWENYLKIKNWYFDKNV